MGWNRKEWRGHKDFQKGEQAGSRDGCLKRAGTHLPTMNKKNFENFEKL